MLKQFTNDTFPINLAIGVDEELSNVTKHFRDSGDNSILNTTKWQPLHQALTYSGIINTQRKNTFLLVFKETPSISCICHEVSHVTKRIWESISEKEIGDEADAYLTEWIMRCFCKTFKITVE